MAVVTLVMTPLIFRTQPRETAARVVGAVMPVCFRDAAVMVAAALAARFAVAHRGESRYGIGQWRKKFLVVDERTRHPRRVERETPERLACIIEGMPARSF